ncbi:MAG: 23S rRNA (guanosine(2251)-2'-O)-methyltransferase RlmB [Chitinophagia bacterium]|nr:23S rRNA (guanosine(2251)-2'-O)-methyltransferase RlmB [Chitinophagia bacterium]
MKKNATHIIGRQPVLEALREGNQLERVFIQRNASGEIIEEIRILAQKLQIPINSVPLEKLHSLTKANHQGVIGLNSIIQYIDLQDAIDHVVQQAMIPLFVMLDGITDVRNIGAIARTALCCGAQLMIIPDKGIGAFNEEALKSSAGALQKIMVARVPSLLKAIDTLHLNGIQVLTAEMKSSTKIFDADMKQPICLVMGSEDKGIQPYISKAADIKFTIPMAGDFDSFNVGVACGIILFEASKQRM